MNTRRTKTIRGFVNFPVDSEEYKCSGEGGMFVRLVVIEPNKSRDDEWMACCGGYNYVTYDESFIRDDVRGPQRHDREYRAIDDVELAQLQSNNYDKLHFPRMHEERESQRSYVSTPYLAAMTIGSTGWSGYSEKKAYWFCTYSDLTVDGKRLYDLVKKLYVGCDLYLQTWLDT